MKRLAHLTASLALLLTAGCGDGVTPASAPSTPIWVAAGMGDAAIVREHLATGTNLDARAPSGGVTALTAAAAGGHTEVVQLLIENGAQLEIRDDNGSTALMVAVFLCHEETVKLLLGSGAQVNVKNHADLTPLDTVTGEWSPDLENAYHLLAELTFRELDVESLPMMRPKMAVLLREYGGKSSKELPTANGKGSQQP